MLANLQEQPFLPSHNGVAHHNGNAHHNGITLLEPADLVELSPSESISIPLDLLDASPRNPRHEPLPEIRELADSIAEFTLLQPITVRRIAGRYQILSGHRRTAAYHLLADRDSFNAAWHAIPAVIRHADDDRAYLMLLTAQVHFAEWAPREQAAALEQLALGGMTLEDIGTKLHRSTAWVSKRLRVFTDSVLSGYVQSRKLAPSIAEELLPVLDVDTKKRLAAQAADENLSQDQVKGRVRALRLDRQLSQIGRLSKQLLDLLSQIDPRDIPVETTRDLWVLHGRVEVLARGTERHMPTVEEAE